MHEYTDIQAVEDYILQDIDSAFEPRVLMWIAAMSEYMNGVCNRVLCRTAGESESGDDLQETFTYDGDNTEILHISDCNTISEVKMDGIAITDYVAYPQNKPWKSRLAMASGARWNKGRANITVKAVQAMFSELPDDLKLACTILVGGICNAQILQMKGKSETIGNYSITYSDQQKGDLDMAKSILSKYTRIAIG